MRSNIRRALGFALRSGLEKRHLLRRPSATLRLGLYTRAVVCASNWSSPHRGQVDQHGYQATRNVFIPTRKTGQQVHGEKRENADLEGLKRPRIRDKHRRGRVGQQQKKANGDGDRTRRFSVTASSLTQVRVNWYTGNASLYPQRGASAIRPCADSTLGIHTANRFWVRRSGAPQIESAAQHIALSRN